VDSSVSSQDDFAYGYDRRYETEGGNLFKHMEEIKAVIEDDFIGSGIVAPYSNMDLGIVITGHDVSKAGAYTLEDSETSKKAWKELFQSLQHKLQERLKSEQSFCERTAGGPGSHGDVMSCSFCKRNHAASLDAQDSIPDTP
jgi:hypothetical protein